MRPASSGGGGNLCALAIQKATADILIYVRTIPQFAKDQTLIQVFNERASQVRFLAGKNLDINGQTVNAINYPQLRTIVLDPHACEVLEREDEDGTDFLHHEYAAIAGIQDSRNEDSALFAREVFRVKKSLKRTWAYAIIPYTSVGRYALAWGVLGGDVDFGRVSEDPAYRESLADKALVVYLVDQLEDRILNVVWDRDISIFSEWFSIALYGDEKAGLAVVASFKWSDDIVGVFRIKQGPPLRISDAELRAVDDTFEKAALSLGIRRGTREFGNITKGDVTLTFKTYFYVPQSARLSDYAEMNMQLNLRDMELTPMKPTKASAPKKK